VRALGFLVADKNMEACLHGLFDRDGWRRAVGCGPVEIAATDVHVAAGHNDPGIYSKGDDLLRPFVGKYARMVIMVDAQWEGSPGVDAIRGRVAGHLAAAGWRKDSGLVLVLDPELDVWLWTRTDHTAKALGWERWSELEGPLAVQDWWASEQDKPSRPKEAAEWALRQRHRPRSSQVYRRLAGSVGLGRCTDEAFVALRDALRRWFPLEGA
jgi:hypothetical protein